MTILSILKKSLIDKEIEVYQCINNPGFFLTRKFESVETTTVKVVVTDVIYIDPIGEYEEEGGDYFEIIFAEGSATLANA